MTTPNDRMGAETTAAQAGAGAAVTGPTARVRATSAGTRRNLSPEEAVVTTIEIPVVGGGAARSNTASARRRRSGRREPAPLLLRLLIWLLVFCAALGAIGLVVEHARPNWLAFLRKSVAPIPVASSAHPAVSHGRESAVLTLVGASGSTTYAVSTERYTLVITTAEKCYVIIHNPATASSASFASVITPQMSPKKIPVVGSSAITLDAQALSLQVISGSKTLGTITKPKLGTAYTFEPTGG